MNKAKVVAVAILAADERIPRAVGENDRIGKVKRHPRSVACEDEPVTARRRSQFALA